MICIIPARKGSKRIKNKNLKKILNKPLIAHTIQIVKKSKIFSRIIVSTDCEKIAKIAKKNGAEIPFIRKKNLSGDYVGTKDVMRDAIKNLNSENIKYHFCVYPTSILLSIKDLKRGLSKIKRTNSDYLITLKNFFHPPQRSILIKNSYEFKYLNKSFISKRTQDLKKYYHDAGAFYIYKTSSLNKNRIKKTFIILKKFKFFDIDDIEDLRFIKKIKTNTF